MRACMKCLAWISAEGVAAGQVLCEDCWNDWFICSGLE